MLARTLLLTLGLTTICASASAAEPEAPAAEASSFHLDARTSVGASLSTNKDDAYLLGAHVLARKGWLTFGLAGETAGYTQGSGRQFVAGAAGATWESRHFRLTGVGLFGVHRWYNSHAELIARDDFEHTAFVGARTDLEVRVLNVGPIELAVGLWASATLDLHRERQYVFVLTSDSTYFIKGEARGSAGLSAGLTF